MYFIFISDQIYHEYGSLLVHRRLLSTKHVLNSVRQVINSTHILKTRISMEITHLKFKEETSRRRRDTNEPRPYDIPKGDIKTIWKSRVTRDMQTWCLFPKEVNVREGQCRTIRTMNHVRNPIPVLSKELRERGRSQYPHVDPEFPPQHRRRD